jgi:very-short-patch-repair endonuclease
MIRMARHYLTELRRQNRKNPTPAERILWNALRNRQLEGARFAPQKVIGRYIVDFYCHAAQLIVELDGSVHDTEEVIEYDAIRTQWFEAQGLTVVRFRNGRVYNDLPGVLEIIRRLLNTPNN